MQQVLERRTSSGTVVLSGEIDVNSLVDAERQVRAAARDHRDLVLDLRAATLLDSRALNLIADTAHRARERGGKVRVLVTRPIIRRVLRMMFFEELVEVVPPLTAADDRDGPTVLPL